MDIKELSHFLVYKYYEIRSKKQKELFSNKNVNIEDVDYVFQQKHVQVAVGRYKEYKVLFFMGSNQLIDWIYNFNFPFTKTPYKETGTNEKIKIHSGFYKSYLLVRENIHEIVLENKKLIIMGQSFGASIASIASLDIAYNFNNLDLYTITTGSPRFGNKCLIESYNKRVPNTIRYVYGNDLVTHLPPKFLGFRHVDGLHHLGKEKLVPNICDHFYTNGYLKEL